MVARLVASQSGLSQRSLVPTGPLRSRRTLFDIPRFSHYALLMEPLHAPWRIEYILAPKPALVESLFTRIAQSSDDEANHVIARDRTCYALLNTYPYTGGHLMVVP